MPFIRRLGNFGLSFLTKLATGYWHLFDPTNGFIAINRSALELVDLSRLDNRFFFETSLLAELYLINVPKPKMDYLRVFWDADLSRGNLTIQSRAVNYTLDLAATREAETEVRLWGQPQKVLLSLNAILALSLFFCWHCCLRFFTLTKSYLKDSS